MTTAERANELGEQLIYTANKANKCNPQTVVVVRREEATEIGNMLTDLARILAATPDVVRHILRYRESALGRLDSAKVVYEHCGTLLDIVQRQAYEMRAKDEAIQNMRSPHSLAVVRAEEAEEQEEASRVEIERLNGELAQALEDQTPLMDRAHLAETNLAAEKQRADSAERERDAKESIIGDCGLLLCEHFGDRICLERAELPAGIELLIEQIKEECRVGAK